MLYALLLSENFWISIVFIIVAVFLIKTLSKSATKFLDEKIQETLKEINKQKEIIEQANIEKENLQDKIDNIKEDINQIKKEIDAVSAIEVQKQKDSYLKTVDTISANLEYKVASSIQKKAKNCIEEILEKSKLN